MSAVAPPGIRDTRIEWLKLIAILAIVFQHTAHASELSPITRLTHGAVPLFTFLSNYFSTRTGLGPSKATSFLRSRFIHLYGLFLLWNSLYFAIRYAASGRSNLSTAFTGFTFEEFFFSGYANAMWFLPFILFANVAGFVCGRLAKDRARIRYVLFGLTLGIAAISASSPWFASDQAAPDFYMASLARKALPSALLGILAALCGFNLNRCPSPGRAVSWAIAFLAALLALNHWGRIVYGFETVLGLSLIGLALNGIPRNYLPFLDPKLSLWLFVAHPLFLHAMRKALALAHLEWESSGWQTQVLGYSLLIGGMIALFFVVVRTHLCRFLLLSPNNPQPRTPEFTPSR